VAFDGGHLTPVRFGLPTLLVAALFVATAASVVYTPLRQRIAYAAFPLVLGAAALGASGVLWLVVGPLGASVASAFVAHVLANPSVGQYTNLAPVGPPTIELAPDIGLYAFILGAAGLTAAGYQLLVSAMEVAAAPLSSPVVSGATAGTETALAFEMPGVAEMTEAAESAVVSALPAAEPLTGDALPAGPSGAPSSGAPSSGAPSSGAPSSGAPSSAMAAPATQPPRAKPATSGATGVVLPGTAGWHHASDTPTGGRNAPPLHGLTRQGGPRG
jgi:hypothetical protein